MKDAKGEEQPAGTGGITVALVGNPNVGKSTLFNALTGLKAKVANYPGVTVEKKAGALDLGNGPKAQLIDLPGTYSLAGRSPDEHVATQVVLGQMKGTPRPDVIVVVADASNLERNLYLVTQVLELGTPTVVALTMMDIAAEQGKTIDAAKLGAHLRATVVVVQAHRGLGISELKTAVMKAARRHTEPLELPVPQVMQDGIDALQSVLVQEKLSVPQQAEFDAAMLLATEDEAAEGSGGGVRDERRDHPRVKQALAQALAACAAADIDPVSTEIEAHYAFIGSVVADVQREAPVTHADGTTARRVSTSDRIDRVLTHKMWGMLIFIGVMATVFVSIFYFAAPVMDFLKDDVLGGLGGWIGTHMSEGPLRSLIVNGVIAGVGNVVVFLPQIFILFLFLAILEDSGYMSRAAFLMDRVMSKVGLHGKSFIPMLSGYACAVPAIMGTRVIENRRDRLATILVLPLMSCSARLPVYALIIATFFAGTGLLASLKQASILLAMYALGTLGAFAFAWLFKRTLLKGPPPAFILEMPPYRVPHVRVVLATVATRCWAFLKRAGTLIFAFSVIMWAATNYPRINDAEVTAGARQETSWPVPAGEKGEEKPEAMAATTQEEAAEHAALARQMEHSIAGRVGKFIEPVFRPLGYDWKLSVGVTGAFFAREVIVSTLGIVYSVGEADEESEALQDKVRADYTPLVGLSLMVFVVFCMQCLSTLAVAHKETGHWGWPVFMFFYMTALAWVAAFITYQGGRLLGFS